MKKQQLTKLKTTLFITAAFALLFFVFRFLLLVIYKDYFATLGLWAAGSSFINGFRFDFSMMAVFLLPLLFLFNLPVRNKDWGKIIAYLICSVFVVFFGVMTADLLYFGNSFKHITEELLMISNDAPFLFGYFFSKKLLFLFSFFFIVSAFWLSGKLAKKYEFVNYEKNYFKSALTCFIILLFVFLGIRGRIFVSNGNAPLGVSFARKSIGIGDAYLYADSSAQANLILNGVFTSFHVMRQGKVEFTNDFPAERAVETAQQTLIRKNETVPDVSRPLMRHTYAPGETKNYNFFIVLLEGWSPEYIDALAGTEFGVTPNFDKIIKGGLNFTSAYSAGLRSIFGFAAVYAGVPMLPGMPVMGYGLELADITPIGRHFNELGYYTVFAQASNRDSYRLCSLAEGMLGVKECYGKEDMPRLMDYKEKAEFGYDYDMLMFTADKVNKHKNFLAMTFTAITHDPFTVTTEQFEKYPRGSWHNEYLNSLYYADYSVGAVIEKAKAEGWFDNTIFIFLSDHTAGERGRDTIKGQMKIPFVIYAPSVFKAETINYTVSQLDVLPTIYDIMNLPFNYTALGKSVFDKDGRVAFFGEGLNIGLITDGGAIRHNGQKITDTQIVEKTFDPAEAEEKLLSLDKAARELLKNNKWYTSK